MSDTFTTGNISYDLFQDAKKKWMDSCEAFEKLFNLKEEPYAPARNIIALFPPSPQMMALMLGGETWPSQHASASDVAYWEKVFKHLPGNLTPFHEIVSQIATNPANKPHADVRFEVGDEVFFRETHH